MRVKRVLVAVVVVLAYVAGVTAIVVAGQCCAADIAAHAEGGSDAKGQ